MRNVVRSHRVTYRKPDGIFRLTKIMNLHEAQIARYSQPMQKQIEQLIAELEAKAQRHEDDAENESSILNSIPHRAKAIATYQCIARLYSLLADSKPVSADLGTVGRVEDSE